jgi:hypothetical protein
VAALGEVDMEAVRAAQIALEGEIPVLRQRLLLTKESMADLVISEVMYSELKRKKSEDLSVKEHVSIKIHDLNASHRVEVEKLRRELEVMQEALVSSHDVNSQEARRAASRIISAEHKASDLELQVQQLEETSHSLNIRLGQANAKCDELTAKGRAYDTVASQAEKLSIEGALIYLSLSCALFSSKTPFSSQSFNTLVMISC